MINIDLNLVLALIAFTWHYCLFCGYVSDDHAAVAQRKDIIPDDEKRDRGESYWTKRFNDGIVMFYQTRLFWLFELKDVPFAWHLFSLIIHVANAWLLFYFLMPIIGYQQALLATAFWGINPMLNQNVVWISGRPYLFGFFFALLALNCWFNPLAFGIFYMLGVVTNISIFFAPILLLMVHPEAWQAKLYIAVMLMGGLPFIVWKFNKRFTKGLVIDRDNFAFRKRKLNTFARMVAYYIWCFFVPVRMGWYHQAGFRYNEKWEKFNYLNFIGYGIIAFLIFSGLPGWWFILGLIPCANIWATNSFIQDRYLYFCSVGIAIIVAPFLVKYPALMYCALTFYVTRAYMYSRQLKNDELMYRENWRNHPKSDFAINNLSYFLINQGRMDEAAVCCHHGLNINQANKMLWFNLGITHAARGHFANEEGKLRYLRALECFNRALQLEPRWIKAAEQIKRLVILLVENKVIHFTPAGTPTDPNKPGMSINVPNLVGMKEILEGKNNG